MSIAAESALSGLRAAQKQLDVAANNVANASTQGYTRKVLPPATLIIGGAGHGVTLTAIQRSVDALLIKDLQSQNSLSASADVTRMYMERIQDFNGPSDAKNSIAAVLSNLAQNFTDLTSKPDDPLSLQKTLTAATQVANKFNGFSNLVTQMRNQVEQQISAGIGFVNEQLKNIGELNTRIEILSSGGQSSADLEDQRDEAIRQVSKYLDISTFPSNVNTIVVMTKQGQKLADGGFEQIQFVPSNIVPGSYYPGGNINGITLGLADITNFINGGELGALINLRDNVLPTYSAEVDELAQKMSERMSSQGLDLFTDLSGNVPASVAPPATVPYVGYASVMRVNTLIQADPSLIRNGTNGNTVLPGSNEVIRKIALYAFGTTAYQQSQGTADLGAAPTIFAATGMQPVNKRIGNLNIAAYTPDLTADPAILAGAQFSIDIGAGAQNITINPGDTAATLAANINAALGPGTATINGLGQLSLNANDTITIADNTLGAAGIAALGFSFGATPAQNPSFTVQVGTQNAVTININAASTPATLLASLNAITGLSATLNGSNQLVLVPTEGGDITLTDGAGSPVAALGMATTNIGHAAMRSTFLGPNAGLTTGLLSNATIENYARSIITNHSEDAQAAEYDAETASSYLQVLDKRAKDTSGVNIDQEMAEMIRIQANYTAAAKMLAAAERMLDELMNIF